MGLEKYKIQEKKMGFIILCCMFLAGLLLMAKIADLATETAEIEAVVVHTYVEPPSKVLHSPGGPKMNLEWVDLNGEVQRDGALVNKSHLEVGDRCRILVDAKTQSRRVLSRTVSLFVFGMGVFVCFISILLMKIFYGKEK